MKKEWMEALVEGLFFVEASMKRWRWAALAPELSGLCDRASGLDGVGSVASRSWGRGRRGAGDGGVRAGSGGAGGLNRGLTRCFGGCSTLDPCESASGAGRIDTSEAARFALRGDAFSVRSDRLARALARWHASGQPVERVASSVPIGASSPHLRPCRLRDASHRGFCSVC